MCNNLRCFIQTVSKKSPENSSVHTLMQRQRPNYSWERWPHCTTIFIHLLCYLTLAKKRLLCPREQRESVARFGMMLRKPLLFGWQLTLEYIHTENNNHYYNPEKRGRAVIYYSNHMLDVTLQCDEQKWKICFVRLPRDGNKGQGSLEVYTVMWNPK